MPLHPQVQQLMKERAGQAEPPAYELPISEARLQAEREAAAPEGEREAVHSVTDLEIEAEDRALPARLYEPLEPVADTGVLCYYHGGGFATGSVDIYDARLRRLANRTGWSVLGVDYRLAPEYPFPAAVEDADVACRWAQRRWGNNSPVAVGGDSAGAALAAVTCRRLRDRGDVLPASQVLIYPVTDFAHDTASARDCATGYGLTIEHMRWYRSMYLRSEVDMEHPDASCLRARDLSGLPPALVMIAEYDPLRDEGAAYARRLAAAGVEVDLQHYEGHMHGFIWEPFLDDSWRALDAIGAFLQRYAQGRQTRS